MELKHGGGSYERGDTLSFNRTFMELKPLRRVKDFL